jgi:hypothetical protein
MPNLEMKREVMEVSELEIQSLLITCHFHKLLHVGLILDLNAPAVCGQLVKSTNMQCILTAKRTESSQTLAKQAEMVASAIFTLSSP